MQFIRAISILAYAATSTLSSPVPETIDFSAPANTTERIPVNVQAITMYVTMSTDSQFRGSKYTWTVTTGYCYNFAGEQYNIFNDKVSALAADPDNGHSYCRFYQDDNCPNGGPYYQTRYDNDLGDVSGAWNDRISSWRCYE